MIEIKRGTTFEATITYDPPADAVQTLSNMTLLSQIRKRNGELVDNVDTTIESDGITVNCKVQDTTEWPHDVLLWDIQFTDENDDVFYSETVELEVKKSISHDNNN